MGMPKGWRNDININRERIGPERRKDILDGIADKGTFLPKGVLEEDMDQSVVEFAGSRRGGQRHHHHFGRCVFHQFGVHCHVTHGPCAAPWCAQRGLAGLKKCGQYSIDLGDSFGRCIFCQCVDLARGVVANRGVDGGSCATRGFVHHRGGVGAPEPVGRRHRFALAPWRA